MLAERHGWNLPVTLQPQYSLLVRGIEHEIVPAALDAGLGLLPWSPLGGGWLSGKYVATCRRRAPLGSGRTRSVAWRHGSSETPTRAPGRSSTHSPGSRRAREASPSQVALAWLAAQPAVTSVILGARSVEQLRDNMGAVTLELDAAELESLTAVSAPRTDDYPYGEPGTAQRHRKIGGGRVG